MRLWERIHKTLADMRIGETLGEDLQGFVRIWERIHETLGDFRRGFVRIHETFGDFYAKP